MGEDETARDKETLDDSSDAGRRRGLRMERVGAVECDVGSGADVGTPRASTGMRVPVECSVGAVTGADARGTLPEGDGV